MVRLNQEVPASGYTLVVCEKPDAARRIADALSEGRLSTASSGGTSIFSFEREGESFVVCAAQGHLYDVSDPFDERSVYPVFDTEWFQRDLVDEGARGISPRVSSIARLAKNAGRFVNACDYDVEGETIGFNVLRYACGGKEASAARAKFSTLTKDELVRSFACAAVEPMAGMASAGRARHLVDFVWGVNLSRMLSRSLQGAGQRYKTVSIGRVQGPTLGFVVDREREICSFVPLPYWSVRGIFDHHGERVTAGYSVERLSAKAAAEKVRDDCVGEEGVVEKAARSVFEVAPPPPFNIGDLQKEAYRHFGLSPSRTLQIAERLYLDALISYPRTGSQKLPASIGYRKIIAGIAGLQEYSVLADELLRGNLAPRQGAQDDLAHPAIYPTGERPRKSLDATESKLFDLVVRRFLAAFAPASRRESLNVEISVGEHVFRVGGSTVVSAGWTRHYGRYHKAQDVEVPPMKVGDRLGVLGVEVGGKFEAHPPRYNQSSLLERMEKEGIGTKATRADTISTLVQRGYVSGESLVATDLGFSVVETMKRHAEAIVSTGMTERVEEGLEKIESGAEGDKRLIRENIRELSRQLISLNEDEEAVGRDLGAAAAASAQASNVLGQCPVCKTGKLQVIRSRKTHKRFVGCSNYGHGCSASAPLPQRGNLKVAAKPCQRCGWPIVSVWTGRYPWKLCVNLSCPSRVGKSHEVRGVPER